MLSKRRRLWADILTWSDLRFFIHSLTLASRNKLHGPGHVLICSNALCIVEQFRSVIGFILLYCTRTLPNISRRNGIPRQCHYCPLSLTLFVRNGLFNQNANWYEGSRGSQPCLPWRLGRLPRSRIIFPTSCSLYQAYRSLQSRASALVGRKKNGLSKGIQRLKWRYDRCATKAELWPDAGDTCARHRVSEDDSRWNDEPFPVCSRTAC